MNPYTSDSTIFDKSGIGLLYRYRACDPKPPGWGLGPKIHRGYVPMRVTQVQSLNMIGQATLAADPPHALKQGARFLGEVWDLI